MRGLVEGSDENLYRVVAVKVIQSVVSGGIFRRGIKVRKEGKRLSGSSIRLELLVYRVLKLASHTTGLVVVASLFSEISCFRMSQDQQAEGYDDKRGRGRTYQSLLDDRSYRSYQC